MIWTGRVDDRHRGRKVALLDLFRLQSRIDARAPDSPVDIDGRTREGKRGQATFSRVVATSICHGNSNVKMSG